MYDYKNFSTIFVSQLNGSDSSNGLSPASDNDGNAPLRTLEGAITLAKKLRKEGVERPLTVALTDDYYTDSVIEITEVEKLTVESFGERKKVIGGIRIDGWECSTLGGVSCLSAKIPSELSSIKFTDLFISGARATVTRFPKQGLLRVKETASIYKSGKAPTILESIDRLTLDTCDLVGVYGIENAVFNFYHYWIDEHIPIKNYDADTGDVELEYKTRFTATALYDSDGSSSVRYFLTGIKPTHLECGEWYADCEDGRIYYAPKEGEYLDNIEAFIPLTDKLFEIRSNDVRLRNLELFCTKSDYASRHAINPKTGNYEPSEEKYGADIQSVCWAEGAVRFCGNRGGVFNSKLHGLGIHAIEIMEGSSCVTVENNEIYDIAAGGIKIVGGVSENDKTAYCRIRRNEIRGVGMRYSAGCGIILMHAHDCEISENEIHDTGYSAISIGWVWGYAENPSYGNVVRANHIYDIGRGDLSDLGGIYLLGKQQGTVISENRIHDLRCRNYGAWGIYLDQGGSFVTVENNVVYKTAKTCFQLHFGSHNVVRNNVFVAHGTSCLRGQRDEDHPRMVFENNILIANERPVYSLYSQLQHGIGAGRNIIWSLSGKEPYMYNVGDDYYSFERWQNELGFDEGSIVADPLIPGLSEFDFTIAADSPAIALGFKPLPDCVAKPKNR